MHKPTKSKKKGESKAKHLETRRLLFSGCEDEHSRDTVTKKYKPDFHPDDIVAFFKDRFEKVCDPKKFTTDKGQVGYTTKPVFPPTISAYAIHAGVCAETIWAWGKQFTEFGEALRVAKAYEATILVNLGAVGALNPQVTNFILKNLHGWTDRIEETHKGSVALQFDKQDEDA